MNYYNEIKNKLIDNEVYSKIKDYLKERHKVINYIEQKSQKFYNIMKELLNSSSFIHLIHCILKIFSLQTHI